MNKAMTKENLLGTIYPIPLGEITISDGNVRHADPTRDLDELAASIKKLGLLQPVVLLGEYGKPPYELISGQRRFLAHEKLKLPDIRAVFAGRLSKTQQVVRSLVENLQRCELEYIDTAKAVTQLYKDFGKDERKVQEQTGLSLRKIRDLILINERATPKMKAFLRDKKVTPMDVKRAIRAAQDNLTKAEELLDLIIQLKPTVHQKRRLVMYGEQDGNASAKKILKEAMEPHVEQNIVIALPDDIRAALTKATKSTSMEPEELAAKILADWLRVQGFIS